MHIQRKKRWLKALWITIGVGLAVAVFLMALKDNIDLYCEPAQIKHDPQKMQQCKRVGGLVKRHSTQHFDAFSQFILLDDEHEVTVRFSGVFPDLFKDGQGIIARGQFINSRLFVAEQVLAKHDETYTPRPAPQSTLPTTQTPAP